MQATHPECLKNMRTKFLIYPKSEQVKNNLILNNTYPTRLA